MNYILSYYQKIADGSVTVGRYVRSWYEYIVKGLEAKSFFYDQKAAKHVIEFCETYCRHHEGPLAPQKIVLEEWQKAFLSVVFGIKDKTGARQFREILLVIGRKNGKTLLAAAIAAYCAYKDGEYGGRIYMTAPKLQQAKLCFDAFYQMVRKEPALDKRARKRRTDVYIDASNTSVEPLAFSSKTSDGLNISVGIQDEVASWRADQGLRFYEVLKSSVGARRQPLLLNISTAGYENDGVFDELVKRSTRVLKGESKETRLAPFIYTIDDVSKWTDITEIQKANPNLGVSVSVDYILDELAIAEGSLSKRAEFLTKYCNVKQSSSAAFLDSVDIEAAFGEPLELEDFRGSYCVGGIDLSQSVDLTACCIVIERGGELYVFTQFFLPGEKMDIAQERDGIPYWIYRQRGLLAPSGENYVNYDDCFDWFKTLVERYEIYPLKVGYDRYSAQTLVAAMKSYGFHMDDVYQGDNLWPIIQQTEALLKDRKLHAGDNDLLKIHFYDAAVKMSVERGRGKLVKLSPTAHIDGMAALLDALTVRDKYFAEIGDQLRND